MWNVCTLKEPGKMQELAEHIKEMRIEILAVQETRWPGTGIINKNDYTMYYSGTRGRTGQAGTGFIVMGKMQNHVIEFLPLNESVCKLRVRNKYSNIILIICYAPTEDKEDEVKDSRKRYKDW
jgi:exonuclease III